jgi:hypothetical protein
MSTIKNKISDKICRLHRSKENYQFKHHSNKEPYTTNPGLITPGLQYIQLIFNYL